MVAPFLWRTALADQFRMISRWGEKIHLNMDTDDDAGLFSAALDDLRNRMMAELGRLDEDKVMATASPHERLKYFSSYYKTLENIEAMVERLSGQHDDGASSGIDVVEFRRQLEEQIERLVAAETPSAVSGEPE